MRTLSIAVLSLLTGLAIPVAATSAFGESPMADIRITRVGTQPSVAGPANYFTGTVRLDPLFQPEGQARTSAATVTFEPNARTAWHTHPVGQSLIVTAGAGRIQQWGGPIQEIRSGDVVWFPAGVKHWHGASPTTAMSHIAVQEQVDGSPVTWMEKVSDSQYSGE